MTVWEVKQRIEDNFSGSEFDGITLRKVKPTRMGKTTKIEGAVFWLDVSDISNEPLPSNRHLRTVSMMLHLFARIPSGKTSEQACAQLEQFALDKLVELRSGLGCALFIDGIEYATDIYTDNFVGVVLKLRAQWIS